MKKLFSLFAAVLMAGSLMAEDAALIKFEAVQPATEVAGSTYGSDGFTLVIPAESDKATVDENKCTFGVSDEDKIQFTHRLKTGGASSKDGRIFTLNIPEEGPLAIYARTSSKDATDRSFLIANGADTIVYHICLDTDTVEGASSKIFLPVIVENVPAGSYKITYNNGINFYGFQMGVEETENTPNNPALLYEMTTDEIQGTNNSYAGNCDIEMGDITWNFTGNAQMNPWRIGGKSLAKVDREVYSKTAFEYPLDSVLLHLGLSTLTSLDGLKLIYSTKDDFSEAKTVVATVPEKFPASVTFAVEGGFPANAYYKFIFTCTVDGTQNKYVQFNGVDFWGQEVVVPVEKPEFSVAAGSYYDAQEVELTCATEGATIYYQTTGDWADAVAYTSAITISETTTLYAQAVKGADKSAEVSKTYEIAKHYASLTELVNEAGTPAGQKVVVTLNKEVIDSLYYNKSGKCNGVYLTAAERMVEIYCYDVPAEWEVGGMLSGTLKGEWKEYQGTWEVCPASWEGLTYDDPIIVGLDAVATENKAAKMMVNGQLVIVRDGKTYNAVGAQL